MRGRGFFSMRISGEEEDKAQEDIVMTLDIAGKSVNQRFIEDVIMAAVSDIHANVINRRFDEDFADSKEEKKHESQY